MDHEALLGNHTDAMLWQRMDLNWDLYNLEADVQIPTTLDSLASPPYQSWITDHGILPLFFSVVSHCCFVIKSPD